MKNIFPGGDGDPRGFGRFRKRLFFNAQDGPGGRELWVTSGTALGTRRVADINLGGDSHPRSWTGGDGRS